MSKISDVARRANVSVATVSRVLNGKKVRPHYKAAVERAIAELEYTPNRTARSLRKKNSELLALIIPDIENPFFTALARGVEDVAHEENLSVVLCNTDEVLAKQDKYLRVAEEENVAGVILAPCGNSSYLEKLVSNGLSVVGVDRALDEVDIDQVTFDNHALGKEAALALVERGYKRIACITGPQGTPTAVDRAKGWAEALSGSEAELFGDLLKHTNFRADGGESAMLELLRHPQPPDAVLATNNLIGVGALRGRISMKEHGIGVAVIGDLPFMAEGLDGVDFVSLNPKEMGLKAASLLLSRLRGESKSPVHVIQPI